MAKWNLPPEPIPSWLDVSREVTATNDDSRVSAELLFPRVVDANLAAGVPVWQALGIAANVASEIGWQVKYRANNLYGAKITKAGALAYKKTHGQAPRWFRAPGNKATGATVDDLKGGDPPWCYYWGYDTLEAGLATWRKTFAPQPKATDTRAELEKKREETANYRLTGYLFWRGDDDWFEALCDAGYKGRNTDANPAPSVAKYRSIRVEVSERWAQSRLAVAVDGKFGPRSQAALKKFQKAHGLPATGVLDEASLVALAAG